MSECVDDVSSSTIATAVLCSLHAMCPPHQASTVYDLKYLAAGTVCILKYLAAGTVYDLKYFATGTVHNLKYLAAGTVYDPKP